MASEAVVRPRRDSRRVWMLVALVLGALAALRFVVILLRNDAYGIAKYYMADDAFYYFQTARNIATGHGSTFDGVHVTNGYHPLWLVTAVVAFVLAPGSSAPLVLLYALQVVMLIGAATLLFLALKEIDPLPAAFTTALFLASNSTRSTLFNGMESTVAFLLCSGLLLLAVRRRTRFFVPATWREALLMLALLVGVSLSRLETGLLAAIWLAIAWAVDTRAGGQARGRIAFVAVGLVAVACAYIAVNLRLVGIPMPVSGMVKVAGHASPSYIGGVFGLHSHAFAGLIAVPGHSRWADAVDAVEAVTLAVALLALAVRLRREDPGRLLALAPFLLFALVFVSSSSIVSHGSYGWYLWPALLLGVLATFSLIRIVLARARPMRILLPLLALATAASTAAGWVPILRTRTLADWGPMRGFVMDETIRFIREQIPVNERIGAISNGIYTYFSGHEAENLEGLANGAEFYRARLDPRAYAVYLRENGIRWIVFRTTADGERATRFEQFVPSNSIDRVYDLDSFYHLGMRRAHPMLSDPNVYFVRLKPWVMSGSARGMADRVAAGHVIGVAGPRQAGWDGPAQDEWRPKPMDTGR